MQSPDVVVVELEARKSWTLARLGALINAGRAGGWLRGEPLAHVADADAILARVPAAETPMQVLARRLALSGQELDIVWVLACVELEPLLANVAQLLVSPGMFELNAQVLERLVARDGSHVTSGLFERLHRLGLIETTTDHRVPTYRRPVRPNDRVLELVRGHLALDRALADVATITSAGELTGAGIELPEELRHCVASDTLVLATGGVGSGRATLLRHAISSAGGAVVAIKTGGLATDVDGLTRQLRMIARECRLHGASPLLLEIETIADHASLIERELLRVHPGPVFATARDACTWETSRTVIAIRVALPDVQLRAQIWRGALPEAATSMIAECADRYALAPGTLVHAARAASALAGVRAVETSDVHTALRSQLEGRLLGLARRVETRQTWADLVLPVDQLDVLIELVARVRHRDLVLDRWGFADKVGKGCGVAALLSGPPGTGKTMVAGMIARELGLDLYQVDLSKVVSKYIGETEKQLAELFAAAESGHAIVLFDEADSLFGRRTEVKSSNDRYANLAVNYLLQRLEQFTGICLLTTNHEAAIDPAFLRRLAFHVRVPMPDDQQRELLWRSMLPARAERASDLAFDQLASQFAMSGGYIKNAVLRAAFLAADEAQPISSAHLWRAARAEYEAMGKLAVG